MYLRAILYVPFRSLLISTMYVWAGEGGGRGGCWGGGGAGERGMESILYGFSWNFNCTHEVGDEYS
jgi:hypothetical protein